MADCSQYPLGSMQRVLCAAGLYSNDATMQRAGTWWYIIIAIILIAVVMDYNPMLGGWMLLLAVVSLVLVNKQGYAIVQNPADKPVSPLR